MDADFHGSAGFYFRIGIVGAVALVLFGILALRLWSLQVLQGPRYAAAAQKQTSRAIDVPAPRGVIVDAHGHLIAGTEGGVAIAADPDALGTVNAHGRWSPTWWGDRQLRRLARLGGVPT